MLPLQPGVTLRLRSWHCSIPAYNACMSTITAILEPHADGTLHLPVPDAWRKLPIRIKAELEPAGATLGVETAKLKGFGCLRGQVSMGHGFDEPLEDFRDYTA